METRGTRNKKNAAYPIILFSVFLFIIFVFVPAFSASAQTSGDSKSCHPDGGSSNPPECAAPSGQAPGTPGAGGPPFPDSLYLYKNGPYDRLRSSTMGAYGLSQGLPAGVKTYNQGQVVRSVDIKIPDGRNGLTPDFNIRVTSAGLGGTTRQTINPGGKISRSTRGGTPQYDDPPNSPDTYDLDLGLLGYEIKNYPNAPINSSCPGQNFRTTQEDFYDICFDSANNRWTVVDTAGTTYTFDLPIKIPGGFSTNPADDTAEWLLTKTEDVHGNAIFYDHKITQIGTIIGSDKGIETTLERVWYSIFIDPATKKPDPNLKAYAAVLVHGPTKSPTVRFDMGYRQQDSQRIDEIQVFASNTPPAAPSGQNAGPNGTLIWKYKLDYDDQNNPDLLKKVNWIAKDGTVFPQSKEFFYEPLGSVNGPNRLGWSKTPTNITSFPRVNLEEITTTLAHLDGDPFVDLVYTPPQTSGCTASNHLLGYYQGQKGVLDLVSGAQRGPFGTAQTPIRLPAQFFTNQVTGDNLCPSIGWDLDFTDVNGDALADAVMTQPTTGTAGLTYTYVIAYNNGKGSFPTASVQFNVPIDVLASTSFWEKWSSLNLPPPKAPPKPGPQGIEIEPIAEGASPLSSLNDMDGDGDLDLLWSDIAANNGTVRYYPFNPGSGWDTANPVVMKHASINLPSVLANASGAASMADINRDGLVDLVIGPAPHQKDKTPEPESPAPGVQSVCQVTQPSSSTKSISYGLISTSWSYYPNIGGKTFGSPQTFLNKPPVGLGGQDSIFTDLDEDGLLDLVTYAQTYQKGSSNDSATAVQNFLNNPKIKFYKNLGFSTTGSGEVIANGWDLVGVDLPSQNDDYVPGQTNTPPLDITSDGNVMLIDVDGDGNLDIYKLAGNPCIGTNEGKASWYAKCDGKTESMWWPSLQSKVPEGLLTQVNEAGGSITNYSYGWSHDSYDATNFAPLTYPVLKTVIRDNGMQNSNPWRHYQIQEDFKYSKPKYDPAQKYYFGFELATREGVIESNNGQPTKKNLEETTYYQDASRVGKARLTVTRIGVTANNVGKVIKKVAADYAADQDNREPWFAPPAKTTTTTCNSDGRTCVNTVTQYTYDHTTGLKTQVNFLGDPGNKNDDKQTNYTYAQSQKFKNVYKVSSKTTGYPKAVGILGYGTGTLVPLSQTYNFYDLPLGSTLPSTPQTSYSGPGNLTQVRNWLQGGQSPAAEVAFDIYGNVVKRIDPNGNATDYTYDTPGYQGGPNPDPYASFLVEVKNAKGHVTKTVYDKSIGAILKITDPNSAKIEFAYDQFARLTKTALPGNTLGSPTSRTDYSYQDGVAPEVLVTYQAMDIKGAPSQRRTLVIRDGLGKILQTRTQAAIGGNTRESVVDTVYYSDTDKGNRTGWPKATTIPRDEPQATGNLSLALSPINMSAAIVNTYDDIGRITRVTYPNGRQVSTQYNSGKRERIVTETVSVNTVRSKKILYDSRGQIIRIADLKQNGSEYAATVFTYDRIGQLTNVTDAGGKKTSVTYDTLGRKTSMKDPSFGQITYAYDNNGNLIRRTDNKGQAIVSNYDALNRLTKETTYQKSTFSSGGFIQRMLAAIYALLKQWTLAVVDVNIAPAQPTLEKNFNYDEPSAQNGIGQLTSYNSGGAYPKKISYDQRGRITETQKVVNGINYSTKFAYDSADHIKTIWYPVASDTVRYEYDEGGRMNKAELIYTSVGSYPKTIASNITYNAQGGRTNLTRGNGAITAYSYDPQDYLLEQLVTTSGSAKLQDYSYERDLDGKITEIDDQGLDPSKKYFSYDDVGRLEKYIKDDLTLPPTTTNYAYSTSGNLTQKGSMTLTYGTGSGGVGPNAVKRAVDYADTYDYAYDLNGNMVSKKLNGALTQTFQWTADNRLASIQDGQGINVSQFFYDAIGNQVEAIHATERIFYIDRFYEETRSGSTGLGPVTKAKVFYFDISTGERVASRDLKDPDLEMEYFLKDHLGSITEIADDTGNIVVENGVPVSVRYDPWGEIESGSPGTQNKYLFGGKELDESSLIRMGDRFYDPMIGRFISPDTIIPDPADPQAWNRYSYVGNDPVNYIDPTGHQKTGFNEKLYPPGAYGPPTIPPEPTCPKCPDQKDPNEATNLSGSNSNDEEQAGSKQKENEPPADTEHLHKVGEWKEGRPTHLLIGGAGSEDLDETEESLGGVISALNDKGLNVLLMTYDSANESLQDVAAALNKEWNQFQKGLGEGEGLTGITTYSYGINVLAKAVKSEEGKKNFGGQPLTMIVPTLGGSAKTYQFGKVPDWALPIIHGLGALGVGPGKATDAQRPWSEEQEELWSQEGADDFFDTMGPVTTIVVPGDPHSPSDSPTSKAGKEHKEKYDRGLGKKSDGTQRPGTNVVEVNDTTHEGAGNSPQVKDALNNFIDQYYPGD